MKHTQHQSGSVLVISLIIMLVLTMLGVSGMKSAVLEEKMAGNVRDTQLAFQAAEATLREAEKYIDDNIVSLTNFDTDGGDGLYFLIECSHWKDGYGRFVMLNTLNTYGAALGAALGEWVRERQKSG